ncbi:MAG: hypothetical protein WC438_01785 [Candidatus Pacearchaeota archaeon]
MAIFEQLYTLSRAYPIISIIIASILFLIGLRITAKILKWVLWIIAFVLVIAALVMVFY